MKRSLSDKKRRETPEGEADRRAKSVKWDEANLEENDKLKAELNPRKIDEPKTPYHGPMDSDEELALGDAGMAPLTLEDEGALQHLASEFSNGTSCSAASSREEDRPNGWSDSERGEHSSGARSGSHSAHSSGQAAQAGEECESAPRASREKRRRFEARRKQHYNMRDALQRGKELLQEEPDASEAKKADGLKRQ